MPRQLRIHYPQALHHVMSRGNRREDIFPDDVDRQDFLKTLAEACQKAGWQVHWSSFGYYLAAAQHRPDWVRVDRLLGEHGLRHDTPTARQEFERRMEAARLGPGDEEGLKALRPGWLVGSEGFRKQMLEQIEDKIGARHSGELRQGTAEAKAERIVAEELRRLKWLESDLAFRRKSDPAKLGIAARLRRETTLSIKTIASRVHLGASKSANTRLHTAMGRGISGQTAQATFGRRKETTHVKA